MEGLAIPIKILLSFILGAAIGIEREINEKNIIKGKAVSIVGLRSFSLIAASGAIIGILYQQYMGLSILLGGGVILLLLLFYFLDTNQSKDTGITTELAMFFCFFIGILTAVSIVPIQVVIALTVIIMVLLSQKRRIRDAVSDINRRELNASIGFAIIAAVILPFLPNESYALSSIPGAPDFFKNFNIGVERFADIEVFNPFKMWLIVALITGVDLIGYVLERSIGQKKGWLLASAAGGFISSTATTQSLAQQSTQEKQHNHLLAAALVSNMVSFFQIGILIIAINALFFAKILPIISSMIISSAICTVYFLRAKEKKGSETILSKKKTDKEIFDIVPALKFAGIYLLISIFSKVAYELFGDSGFLLTTALGALAGLDAVMINTAQLADKTISYQLGGIAFILANAVNLAGKSIYSFLQGSRDFALKFSLSVVVIIVTSLLGLFFI